ncbi:MAG: serine hydrolase [Woeseiaceae bacterium]
MAVLIAAAAVMLATAHAGADPNRASSQNPSSESGGGQIVPAELAALIDPVFAAGMRQEGIPGAAFVLVQDGHIVLSKGFGAADVASGHPVRPDHTIFPFASISKLFTATARIH